MSRATLLLGAAAIALGGLLAGLGHPPRTPPEPSFQYPGYNLVFVSFDALQAAHMGCQGYFRDTTPMLDALARSGFHFTQAHSVASWTVPSSMTWFTGVYPSEHRVVNKFADVPAKKPTNLRELSPGLMTLAEVLKHNGYATGGFTGNAGVSGMFGYEQGFDTYYAPDAPATVWFFHNTQSLVRPATILQQAHKQFSRNQPAVRSRSFTMLPSRAPSGRRRRPASCR